MKAPAAKQNFGATSAKTEKTEKKAILNEMPALKKGMPQRMQAR